MTVEYLTVGEVFAVHKRILEACGGIEGIREQGALISACERPKTTFGGQELYPDLFLKAAVLLEALVNYHAFSDGNKRTAFMATKVFLALNGKRLVVSTKDGLAFMLAVATKELAIEDIAKWLKAHCD